MRRSAMGTRTRFSEMRPVQEPGLGAVYLGDGRVRFRVWAPRAREVAVRVISPQEQIIPMQARPQGYFQTLAEHLEPGSLYLYRLDQLKERPDPASRSQ